MKFLVFFTAFPLFAAGVSASANSIGVVLTYDAPTSAACTPEMSESPPNPTYLSNLFSGTDLAWPYKTVNGLHRQIAILSGLKAARNYYVRVCGYTTSFTTKAPPIGDVSPRVLTAPSMNASTPDAEFADPRSGAVLRWLNKPGWGGLRSDADLSFVAQVATGSWTNPSNVLLNGTGSYASTSTINDTIMLYPDPATSGSFMENPWSAGRVLEDICAKVTRGAGSFEVGISLDHGTSILAAATGNATGTYPATCPMPMFTSWDASATIPREYIPSRGTVNVTDNMDGTSTVVVQSPNANSRISQSTFTKVLIGSTVWPVVSRSSTDTFIITGSLTATGATFVTLHWGLRIRNTASASLQINAGYRAAGTQSIQSRAETILCSRVARVDLSYLCAVQLALSGSVYLAAVTPLGTVYYLGEIPLSDVGSTAPSTAFSHGFRSIIGFSSTDPNVFYILTNGNDGARRIYSGTYTGLATASIDYAYAGTQGGALPTSPSPSVAWAVVANLTTALAAVGYTNQYDTGACTSIDCWTAPSAISVSGDYAVTYVGAQDDGGAYLGFFKLSTGALISIINTINGDIVGGSNDSFRWGCLHAVQAAPYGPANTFVYSGNQCRSGTATRNAGPWLMTIYGIYRSGVLDTSTKALPWPIDSTYDNTCPGSIAARWQAVGATGANCVHMQVATLPDTATAATKNAGSLKEGDMFVDYTKALALSPNNFETEHFRVVTTPTLVGGKWDFWGHRDAVPTYCNFGSHGTATHNQHGSSWTAMMSPGQFDGCLGVLTLISIDPLTDVITTHETPRAIQSAHFAIGGSPTDTTYSVLVNGAGFTDGNLMTISGLGKSNAAPVFASASSSTAPIQSYPEHMLAGTTVSPWSVDASAYLPSSGCNIESACSIGLNTLTPTGVTDIYEITVVGGSSTRLVSPGLIDYKLAQLIGTIGRFPLIELSTPTLNSLPGAPNNRICSAYNANECITGSVKGHVYLKASIVDPGNNCGVAASYLLAPCVAWAVPLGGCAYRNSITVGTINGERAQCIVSLPLGCGGYEKMTTTPDGKHGFLPPCMWGPDWIGGMLVDLPPYFPDSTASARGGFRILTKTVPAYSYIDFGYNPSFHCVDGRAEACRVVASTVDTSTPFYFLHEAPALTSARSIAVPLISNRIAWVRVNGGPTELVVTY